MQTKAEQKAYQKKWRADNPSYQRKWHKAHPKYNREYKALHLVDKKAKRIYDRAWRKANPARCDKAKREVRTVRWRKAHPEQVIEARRVRDHRRASREHGNGGSWTTEQWLALKAKYDNKCLCCGLGEKALANRGRQLVPDHVIPLAKSGRNSVENLQPLCHGTGGCNNRKGAKIMDYRFSVPREGFFSAETPKFNFHGAESGRIQCATPNLSNEPKGTR